MPESSETENLAADYLAEDPQILTDEELNTIAQHYGISLEKVRTLAKGMSKARSEINPNEIQEEV